MIRNLLRPSRILSQKAIQFEAKELASFQIVKQARNIFTGFRCTANQVSLNSNMNLILNQQFKSFSNQEQQEERREYRGDPRIQKFTKNRLKVIAIPKKITQEELVKKFSEFGELQGFKYIQSEQNDFGEERGVFYFSYASVAEGEKALAAVGEEFTLGEAKLRLAFQRNRFFPSWTRTVFVGNLSRDTTEEDLKDYFSEVGEVLKSNIATDPTNGRPRGFGFIEFLEKKAQYEAIKKDGEVFMGRELNIKPAEERKPRIRSDFQGERRGFEENRGRFN